MSTLATTWSQWRPAATVVAASLAVGTMLIVALGKNPIHAWVALLDGAFAGVGLANLQATINRSAMIVGAALAAGLALRSSFFNIGIEGQMVLGGVTAAIVAQLLPWDSAAAIPVLVAAAAVIGGLWALIAALMQLYLGVPILISSLLLNYPASYLASWLVSHPFRDVASGMPASARLPEAMRLPTVFATDVQMGALVVLVVALVAGMFFYRMAPGYEARMTGLSMEFARASGVRVNKVAVSMVFASGAVAGIVGALAVVGEHHRYIDGMLVNPLYAWTGIMAVLLGGVGIPGLCCAGVFFAALSTGAMGMERTADVPREIARVLLAFIILFVAARRSARLGGGHS